MANYNIFSYLFSTPTKISIVGEGIINILLLDLKVATLRLKSSDSYVCPFGMKTAQHPIITLIHKKNVDILDVANKLNGICNHFDERWVWLIIYRTGNRLVHACLNNRYEWIPKYFECIYSVRLNSIEFLRPVFLHVFCNPNQITNAESIWQAFFKQQRIKSSNAQTLLQEMFTWCRVGLVLELQDTDYDDFYISRELIK